MPLLSEFEQPMSLSTGVSFGHIRHSASATNKPTAYATSLRGGTPRDCDRAGAETMVIVFRFAPSLEHWPEHGHFSELMGFVNGTTRTT